MEPIIATGYLQQSTPNRPKRIKKYAIIRLKQKHLSMVMDLQEIIVRNLQSPDLLHSFSYHFMKQHLGPKGMAFGVFVEDKLIAFRNLYYPDQWDTEWNLGIDIGLAKTELSKVVNLQMVCVHPHYRGNALSKKMNGIALEILHYIGTHHHVCATVSPINIWNIPVLLSSGFRIAKLKEKYDGKIRYVAHQDLRTPQRYDEATRVHVPLEDLRTQNIYLDTGFLGTTLIKKDTTRRISPEKKFDLVLKYPINDTPVNFHHATPCKWHSSPTTATEDFAQPWG